MSRALKHAIVVAVCLLNCASAGVNARANEQVELGESVVEQQRAINGSFSRATAQLRAVQDAASATRNRQSLSTALNELTEQINGLNEVMKSSKKTLAGRPPKSPELAARWQSLLQETRQLKNRFLPLLAKFSQESERLNTLGSLPPKFWNQIRLDLAKFELATFGTIEWMGGAAPPRAQFDFFETKVEMFQQHGSAQVVDLRIHESFKPKSKAIKAELQKLAGIQSQLVQQPNPMAVGPVILAIAPVTDFDEFVAGISVARVTGHDKSRGQIYLGGGAPRPTSQQITAMINRLTDGGTFLRARGGLQYFKPHQILQNHGLNALMSIELRGFRASDNAFDVLKAIWRNQDTGTAAYSESTGSDKITRGMLRYDGTVQAFADQVNYGTVVSADEENRRIIIDLDPDRLTPEAMLATLESATDPEAALARKKLQALARGTTWEDEERAREEAEFDKEFAETQSRIRSARQRNSARIAKESKAISDRLEESMRRSREKSRRSTQQMRRTMERAGVEIPAGLLPAEEDSTDASPLGESSSWLAQAVEEFYPQQSETRPSLEAVQQWADQLNDDSSKDAQDSAVFALLKLRPHDVSDKKTQGKIARGFRSLALGNTFTEGEHVQGLAIWGGKHSVPYLIEILDKSTLEAPIELYAAFVKLNDSRGASAVAKKLGDFHNHDLAVDCLRLMGVTAESALIKAAPSDDPEVSLAAVNLLGEVGTENSYTLLRKAIKSRNLEIKAAAKNSIKLIRERKQSTADSN